MVNVVGFFGSLGVALPDRASGNATVPCFANPAAHKHDDRTPSCSVNSRGLLCVLAAWQVIKPVGLHVSGVPVRWLDVQECVG
jgi:hypothetical protein